MIDRPIHGGCPIYIPSRWQKYLIARILETISVDLLGMPNSLGPRMGLEG